MITSAKDECKVRTDTISKIVNDRDIRYITKSIAHSITGRSTDNLNLVTRHYDLTVRISLFNSTS